MHIEVLVEDSSGGVLLGELLPKLIGPQGQPHTWRIHSYQGIGRIPRGMTPSDDPANRLLLNNLPRLLAGYGRMPGVDAVVVALDTDQRPCQTVLNELQNLLSKINPAPKTLFRLAIEEIEAWYLGDRDALRQAYPRLKATVLDNYKQDSVCGTWELLADAVYPGGSAAIKKSGWPLPGEIKHEWAKKIGPLLDPERNVSPGFRKLKDGLRRLVATPPRLTTQLRQRTFQESVASRSAFGVRRSAAALQTVDAIRPGHHYTYSETALD